MFKVVPADLARKGDCSAATRAVEAMRDGRERDFEAERVDEICEVAPTARVKKAGFGMARYGEKKFIPGTPVVVSEGSGVFSRARATVIEPTSANVAQDTGRYTRFDAKKEVLLRDDRGRIFSMFKNRLRVKFDGFGVAPRSCRVSKRALAKGTKIERREHGVPVKFARKIARDHLCENSKYYAKAR